MSVNVRSFNFSVPTCITKGFDIWKNSQIRFKYPHCAAQRRPKDSSHAYYCLTFSFLHASLSYTSLLLRSVILLILTSSPPLALSPVICLFGSFCLFVESSDFLLMKHIKVWCRSILHWIRFVFVSSHKFDSHSLYCSCSISSVVDGDTDPGGGAIAAAGLAGSCRVQSWGATQLPQWGLLHQHWSHTAHKILQGRNGHL